MSDLWYELTEFSATDHMWMGSNHEDGTMGDENQESCRVNENELSETLTGK